MSKLESSSSSGKPWEQNYHSSNKNLVYKKLVKDLDFNQVRPSRAGVILYTVINQVYYFGLGVDTGTKELTDWGGGVSYKEKADKNVIYGALREFHEETLGIFGYLDLSDVADTLAIYNKHGLVLFYKTNEDINNIKLMFKKEYDKQVSDNKEVVPEICDMVWLTMSEFKQLINMRGKMFFRIRQLLLNAGDFYWLL